MKTSGFLLRFVDVVLILLFGFIVISDLDEDTRIVLPESQETEQTAPDLEHVIYISITSDGEFLNERESLYFETLPDLEDYVYDMRNRHGDNLKIRIRANYDAQVRLALAAARICDQYEVKKAIDVKLLSR